jgi:glycosyltransferase involved in cell wall biosynthesis
VSSDIAISVVVPTLNGGVHAQRLFRHFAELKSRAGVEILIIDSGSIDGTPEHARDLGLKVHAISPDDFGHGRTRNLGVSLTRGRIICFLTQDVLPVTRDWPDLFERALRDEQVAGVYGRQIPRDATTMEMFFVALNYPGMPLRFDPQPGGHHPRPGRVLFSNAFSAVRRDLIERIPYADDAPVSEDQIWAHAVLSAGHSIVYQHDAEALHAHSYSLHGLFKRSYAVGLALRGAGLDSGGASFGEGIRFLATEVNYFVKQGHIHRLLSLLPYEFIRWLGFHVGRHAGARDRGCDHLS